MGMRTEEEENGRAGDGGAPTGPHPAWGNQGPQPQQHWGAHLSLFNNLKPAPGIHPLTPLLQLGLGMRKAGQDTALPCRATACTQRNPREGFIAGSRPPDTPCPHHSGVS